MFSAIDRARASAAAGGPIVDGIMRALANSDHPLGPQGIMTRVPGYDPDDVKFIIFGLKLLGRIRACGYYADGYASPPSSYEIYTIDNPLEKMAYL